jgi:4-hydroxythreonine-4-phosphate dehydrogenase
VVKTVIVADDLSGAVETAATFLPRTSRIDVTLDTRLSDSSESIDVLAFDTNSRELDAVGAARQTATAFSAAAGSRVVFKKIDSLLRGNVQAELSAAQAIRPHLVIAPALPSAGRVVRNGIVHVDGQPLHATDAWRAERHPAPASVSIALSDIPTRVLPLPLVRSANLAAAIRETLVAGTVPICDAESDVDLDRIAMATAGIDQLVLVGSAALAAALARNLPIESRTADLLPVQRAQRVLVGIGSAARAIAGQLEALREVDVAVVLVQPNDVCGGNPDRSARVAAEVEAATQPVVVVAVDPGAAVDAGRSREIARGFATTVARSARAFDGLLLTGGETARAVLDQLGVTQLRPLFEVHHGAVVCAAPDDRLIATRPGSFGDRNSLLSIVRALQSGAPPTKESP